MPGVETSLPVMLTHAAKGRCTVEDVVRWMCANVADCYQMVGKGRIEVGADADLVLVDMVTQRTVDDANAWSRVGWNPFHGRSLVGWPSWTIVDGVPCLSAARGPATRARCWSHPVRQDARWSCSPGREPVTERLKPLGPSPSRGEPCTS